MQQVMNYFSDKPLHLFVIWLPAISSDTRDDALERTSQFSDPRVSYYWDAEKLTGKSVGSVLELGMSAWDVYLLYSSNQNWNTEMPLPLFWMHQLQGLEKGPYLDHDEFKEKVQDLISQLPQKHS
jgi:hypothetical protein